MTAWASICALANYGRHLRFASPSEGEQAGGRGEQQRDGGGLGDAAVTLMSSRPYQPYDGGLSRPPNWMVDREEVAVSVNVYSVQPNARRSAPPEAVCHSSSR